MSEIDSLESLPTRKQLLVAAGALPGRHERAEVADDLYRQFCDRLRITPVNSDSLAVYLTWLWESEELSARSLQQRLELLDLAAILTGREPPSAPPEMQFFMKGLFRRARLHLKGEESAPLFREHIATLVDEIMSPDPKQVRLRAAVLLLHHTGWPPLSISRLRWRHVDLRRRDRATISWPPSSRWLDRPSVSIDRRGGPTCPVAALDAVRALQDGSPWVTWAPRPEGESEKITSVLARARDAVAEAGGDVEVALRKVSVTAIQLLGRAELLLGFGAALTTQEALALRQGDVIISGPGLLLAVPGRSEPVGILSDPGLPTDPVNAWREWIHECMAQGCHDNNLPAFLHTHGMNIFPKPTAKRGLSQAVQHPVQRLGWEGFYTWQSLRWGHIRGAIRADQTFQSIAKFVDINVSALALHERRENAVRRSVAGRLGL